MQKFIAEESFWKLFPEAAIGVIVARGMKPASEVPAEDAAAIAALLRRRTRKPTATSQATPSRKTKSCAYGATRISSSKRRKARGAPSRTCSSAC